MKIRSIDEFEAAIASDFSWRRKELSNLMNLGMTSRMSTQETLFKSGVTLLYAHWEGFVKKSSITLCEYINFQGLRYEALTNNFHVCALIDEFQGQYPHKNFKSAFLVMSESQRYLTNKCKINTEQYIDTKSNLNSETLREITLKVGIDYAPYLLKEKFIDESFLGLRNAISHGEYRKIDGKEFTELFNEITGLIDIFKNQILNAAIQRSFQIDDLA